MSQASVTNTISHSSTSVFVYFLETDFDNMFLALSLVFQHASELLYISLTCWHAVTSHVYGSSFIPVTIHQVKVNIVKRGDKGSGGAACAKETSATETEVKNATWGIGTLPSQWDVLTKHAMVGTVNTLRLSSTVMR